MKGSHSGQRSKPRAGEKAPGSDAVPFSASPSEEGAAAEVAKATEPSDDIALEPIEQEEFKAARGSGACLALIATPIGNLGDISARALDWLRQADAVACEDSRVSSRLLRHFGISKPLIPYHDHNADQMRPDLLRRLREGARLALISDAGTPLISDPGYKLVRDAAAQGTTVTALPGPAAPIMALILSGLPTDRFLFGGFLPPKSAARRQVAAEFRDLRASLIFFETAPRLADSLADLADILGDRPAAVTRELTKLYEEIKRGTLGDLAAHYREAGPPRGEIVLVIAPPTAETAPGFDLDGALIQALARMSVKDAAATVAAASGQKKRLVYARALELAQKLTLPPSGSDPADSEPGGDDA
ncbi:16S rRNA (cytidine(1402)-2'-O)-methyltransferase [Dongia soli]|uniref:Ribosomal RNA small subunit methyltransferase I n=1 Tax=Dongia soli TaxID=600628 RepID=A0ABU5E8P0_9PROT|nr:16S rRNA (cytidine(1402)-2'-O)-methyltransferase [Dongia soli]MDY0881913.1 16S rRNA (cytidine(1402)-2'-O)-methyltransferase [Dongia soli]